MAEAPDAAYHRLMSKLSEQWQRWTASGGTMDEREANGDGQIDEGDHLILALHNSSPVLSSHIDAHLSSPCSRLRCRRVGR